MWKRIRTDLIILFLLAFCLIYYYLPGAPSFAGLPEKDVKLQVESLNGVAEETNDLITRATIDTMNFFCERSNFTLTRSVTFVLTANKTNFQQEVSSRFKISDKEAAQATKDVDVLAGTGLIILNTQSITTGQQQIFLTAHEITHQYQRQNVSPSRAQPFWLVEGMAEVVGANIVERQGYGTLKFYRNSSLADLRAAINKPDLQELNDGRDWAQAITEYGSPLTHKVAGLAVLYLTEKHGFRSVTQYMQHISNGLSSNDAFKKTFGYPLPEFIKEYQTLITPPKASTAN